MHSATGIGCGCGLRVKVQGAGCTFASEPILYCNIMGTVSTWSWSLGCRASPADPPLFVAFFEVLNSSDLHISTMVIGDTAGCSSPIANTLHSCIQMIVVHNLLESVRDCTVFAIFRSSSSLQQL